MKGNNTLLLNAATMAEAVQEWLAKRMPEQTPTVTSVRADSSSGHAPSFRIELGEPQPVSLELPAEPPPGRGE